MYLLLVQLILTRVFFFFNDTATTEIYTLSLHDALPISVAHRVAEHPRDQRRPGEHDRADRYRVQHAELARYPDRKSTRLNSSHLVISYAVFCLKKKIRADSILMGSISLLSLIISFVPSW